VLAGFTVARGGSAPSADARFTPGASGHRGPCADGGGAPLSPDYARTPPPPSPRA